MPGPTRPTRTLAITIAITIAIGGCSRPSEPRPQGAPRVGAPDEPGHHSLRSVPHVALECASGPAPAPPGESPLRARQLEVEPQGVARRTLRRLDGTVSAVTVTTDAATIERIQGLAGEALDHVGLAAEAPVPDGTACTLRVTRGLTAEWRLTYPTGHAPMRPLLDALMPLLRGG